MKRFPSLVVNCLFFFSFLTAHSQSFSIDTGAINQTIRRFVAANNVPAISLSIAADDRIVHSVAMGYADLENRVRANNQTLFRIASVTKPITAAAILKLADNNVISIDSPITKYCSLVNFPAKDPTIRQLLSHLGGLADYNLVRRGVWNVRTKNGTVFPGSNPYHFQSISEAVNVFAKDTLESVPGDKFQYSNVGFLLLGCAIEGGSGITYPDYMSREIFQVAGMTRTQPDDAFRIILNRARSYQGRNEKNAEYWWFTREQKAVMKIGEIYNARFEDTSIKLSAGGLLSTSEDLARFAIALQQNKFFRPEMQKIMFTTQQPREGKKTTWGLGVTIQEHKGEKVVGLNGGQPGASAILRILPDRNFVVTAIVNRDLVDLDVLMEEIGKHFGYFLN